MAKPLSLTPRNRQRLPRLGPKSRVNDLLALHDTIERARLDLETAARDLGDLRKSIAMTELDVRTAGAALETIVGIYNRLAVEHERQEGEMP